MLRRLRSYVVWICLVLFIGVGCVGCLPEDLTVVLGGGNSVYTPPPLVPCHGGCYDDYYDDYYYDDYVVIDVIDVGW